MKILNFGSCNVDYVYLLDHIVAEGETEATQGLDVFPGGKGLNQSIAIARAGNNVYHAGCVGDGGEFLLDILKKNGVDVSFVDHVNKKNGHAVIQVGKNGDNAIFLYPGSNNMISREQVDRALASFSKDDILLLQNEINNLDYIIRKAKARGMFVVLNPSPFDEKILALDLSLLDAIIVNETEGNEISGKTEPEEILAELLARYPKMKIVLTLGKHGATYADADARAFCDIMPMPVKDTTAAGDTFTGYFFSTLMQGEAPERALKIATAASAIAVSRMGAAPSIPTMDEVKTLLAERGW